MPKSCVKEVGTKLTLIFMKKLTLIPIVLLSLISFMACSSGPSKTEISDYVHSQIRDALVLKIEILKQEKVQKQNDIDVYPTEIKINYIQPGMVYGNISECDGGQCYKDTEYELIKKYMLIKKGNELDNAGNQNISQTEIKHYWRPVSASLKDFYKDKIAENTGEKNDNAKEEQTTTESTKKDEANINTLKDTRDNKIYKTTKIGEQVWMAENLKFEAPGSTCYDNKPENCDKYGRFYNWNEAMKSCPDGWHLPSKEEWTKLKESLGGDKEYFNKIVDKSEWIDCYKFNNEPITPEIQEKLDKFTNSSGFNLLMGGFQKGYYNRIHQLTEIWSSSEVPGREDLVITFNGQGGDWWDKKDGAYVRCVKN